MKPFEHEEAEHVVASNEITTRLARNTSSRSKGRTWGLDGSLFWFVLVGVFAFVVTLLYLFSVLQMAFWTAFGVASVPLALSLIYVFGFRQGKPPGFDADLLDYWLNGSSFLLS